MNSTFTPFSLKRPSCWATYIGKVSNMGKTAILREMGSIDVVVRLFCEHAPTIKLETNKHGMKK
jgi:hypothetical protein